MDSGDRIHGVSDRVSMCNYRANRVACDAADRYRITEGSEEIQIRNVAGHLFGFISRSSRQLPVAKPH